MTNDIYDVHVILRRFALSMGISVAELKQALNEANNELVIQITDDVRNATVENPDSEITCSHTYAEIFEAIDAGKHIRATLKHIEPCGSTVYAYFLNSRDVTVYDYDSEVRNGEITFDFGVSLYYYLSPDNTISC